MKKKALSEIKFGEKVTALVANFYPVTFDAVTRTLGLDTKTAQKVLADLQKHGYISKDERGFYKLTPPEESKPDRYLVIGDMNEEASTS